MSINGAEPSNYGAPNASEDVTPFLRKGVNTVRLTWKVGKVPFGYFGSQGTFTLGESRNGKWHTIINKEIYSADGKPQSGSQSYRVIAQ